MIAMELRLSEEVLQQLETEAHERLPAHPNYVEQSLTDRVRRSLSWLKRAVQASPEDTPSRFLELWISLNALYGRPTYLKGVRTDESVDFRHYITRLEELDSLDQGLVPLMKRLDRRSLRLVENPYLWKEFWRNETAELKMKIVYARKELSDSLNKEDPVKFFVCLFDRLQILRNQIAHGSSSVNTTKSRDALAPSLLLLEDMLPVFLKLMIRHGLGKEWPEIPYPGRETPQHPKAIRR
jgi:hypothetical protein